MKTATLEDLQTRLPAVLAWVRSGEDVIVKGEPVARIASEEDEMVDWSKSAVFKRPNPVDLSKSTVYRDRTGEPVLSQEDLDALFDHLRGPY